MQTTFAQAITDTLSELLHKDDSIILMGEDIGSYGGAFRITQGFSNTYGPDRIIETPISEGSVMGMAIGAALRGLKPIVEIMFMDFITLCIDQILNHGTKFPIMFGEQARVPVIIRTPAGGGRGYGPTHSQSLESLLQTIPGISIAVPSCPQDARDLLLHAAQQDTITVFVEGKTLYSSTGEVDCSRPALPFGTANTVRSGDDITITAFGRMVPIALQAADILARSDIHAEIIDLRTVKPIDIDTIAASVETTGHLLTVEEGHAAGGIGSEIAMGIFEKAFFALDAPIKRITAMNGPVPASTRLEKKHLPSAEAIAQAAGELLLDDPEGNCE